jgi:hypothetical protein
MFASLATDVPRVLSNHPDAGLSFEQVLGQITKRHDLARPDQTVPLSSLRATDDGFIDVPGLGKLSLTLWSRRALARILGIRWDRWFASESIAPADRALEINRRLRVSSNLWKIRARGLGPDEPQTADGVLRAFVTPTYAPIDDVEVFETLARSLAGQLDAFRFIRRDVTVESSQFAAVHVEEVDLGIEKPDRHKNGFLVANSEVGSRSLTILAWVWRIICTNGLVAPESKLFRMIHRRRKAESMGRRLAEAFTVLPEKWRRVEMVLRTARRESVAEPRKALDTLVEVHPQLGALSNAIHSAYEADPEPTRFGLVQALTRAAQGISPERRLEVEEAAGKIAAEATTGAVP